MDDGEIFTYALGKLDDRGRMFVKPNDPVYEGMIVGMKMPQLHKDGGTGRRCGSVVATRWISHVAASGVVAVLVLKHTIQHNEFFPTRMCVRREMTAWRVTNQRCRQRNFVANAREHATVHACQWRCGPRQVSAVYQHSYREVRVQEHQYWVAGKSISMPSSSSVKTSWHDRRLLPSRGEAA